MELKSLKETTENPLTGNLVFYQNFLPALESGDYTIHVEQTISSTDKKQKIPKTTYESTNKWVVSGPRFDLNPDEISSVYPPEDASGEYGNVFPHVCFTRKTLPWERSAGHPTLGAANTMPDTAPWVGILMIAEDDPQPEIHQITLLDLLQEQYKTAEGKPGQLPKNILYPGFPGANHNELEYGQEWSDPCIALDISLELFNQIAPAYADLPWLGHVREIQPANTQSAVYMQKLKTMATPLDPPRLATVIGNRLPAEGSKSLCCLVSFENWAPYLPQEDDSPNQNVPEGIEKVRLVLLKQWQFYAVSLEQTFSGYLTNLNIKDGEFTGSLLQLPVNDGTSEADKAINNAFNMGFVPLNHHTRQGDQTVSWYKGPFLPCETSGQIEVPVLGPDSATEYNPDTGMFDVSYAAAWQLGRLLALQNKNFAETLYNWKRENTSEAIASFEEEIIRETLLDIVQKNQPTLEEAPTEVLQLVNMSLNHILKAFVKLNKLGHEDESK